MRATARLRLAALIALENVGRAANESASSTAVDQERALHRLEPLPSVRAGHTPWDVGPHGFEVVGPRRVDEVEVDGPSVHIQFARVHLLNRGVVLGKEHPVQELMQQGGFANCFGPCDDLRTSSASQRW
eukprot:CAMPEP_0175833586 /NCGR_PEP_ID=MMETSP0107_2-20121207/15590_1 /TAXON_ID=195067 ORGANISM="Goniomonas pacifica, Strain CCMP1869" /NCGR_SAMPLE_ID=MMETSP0107_2 /ASSEMBLY_ACC=CAM_ASM_000203 /LENGTH=128 /DNA_ID=CAMNT_0017146727 /DNA_START=370 /DNA_END=752 /DNA_ORIENTATION=+